MMTLARDWGHVPAWLAVLPFREIHWIATQTIPVVAEMRWVQCHSECPGFLMTPCKRNPTNQLPPSLEITFVIDEIFGWKKSFSNERTSTIDPTRAPSQSAVNLKCLCGHPFPEHKIIEDSIILSR